MNKNKIFLIVIVSLFYIMGNSQTLNTASIIGTDGEIKYMNENDSLNIHPNDSLVKHHLTPGTLIRTTDFLKLVRKENAVLNKTEQTPFINPEEN